MDPIPLYEAIRVEPRPNYWLAADDFAEERVELEKTERDAAAALDGTTDGPFIVAVETNLTVSAKHYELVEAMSAFNKIRIVNGNTTSARSALYDG